jgi:CspA family cold shock protein
MADNTVADTSSSRYTGRVKWFNNKAGYGFITVTDGPKSGSDIFVHHSSISVSDEQYKYLVQGEYVEFTISTANGGVHEFQAGSVFGIKGGKLMCETRRDVRSTREQYRNVKATTDEQPEQQAEAKETVRAPRSRPAPRKVTKPVRARGQGPREDKAAGEWVQVVAKKKTDAPVKRAPKQTKVQESP